MLNTFSHKLQWKVCGMRDADNIAEVLQLEPNFMGFIFYPKSPRYVIGQLDPAVLKNFPKKTKKVGVFVNQEIASLLEIGRTYELDCLQLHGSESPEICKRIKEEGFGVIKAFSVGESFDFQQLESYLPYIDYFLFDTKADGAHGGHGKAFNWELLLSYPFTKPFLLAGGVDLTNIENLSILKDLPLLGIDVNSKFEIDKALKDISMLKKLKNILNQD